MTNQRPNVLFVMTDQQRADTLGALGNDLIHTPNFDRLVETGVSFTNAYSQTPVCVPARYNIRTGCEPPTTDYYTNSGPGPNTGTVEERAGTYLPRAMRDRGYRTFGVGKFHTKPPYEDLGYETHLQSEELYNTVENRKERDAYGSFLADEFPEYDFLEQPHGERTEMYYMPQMSPLPAEVTVENWAADRAIDLIERDSERPFFGFLSFIGPHPPLAPPVPFNRMYDPDEMPSPIRGDIDVDHMDEQIPWMNHLIWASNGDEPVDGLRVRTLRARYYGEISYIDQCLGRVLNALEERGERENTVVCFFSDHGEHLGDHHAWQKESFFEQSANIPFVVSWPGELPAGERNDNLVCLTDLFGIATRVAGDIETRDGIDVLGLLNGETEPRERLLGYYGEPKTRQFKIMVREGDWKYIWLANGDRQQLFHLAEDPDELVNRATDDADVAARLRSAAVRDLQDHGLDQVLCDSDLDGFSFETRDCDRVHQFASWKDVDGFPEDPVDVLDSWELRSLDKFADER
ncbi:choline-sulfatase [Haloferax sp. Atlit-4N]|uniref:sulfatase family protein n=1 Tax=Haloferax sp. Atlit-4N TaxID=2077206 RepID=UPI000E274D69|nr:sulfatase-like hydrolase/transferase [Haloferax sp. Atlit-4N]RDZ51349.1 choline-sulfatase [Haloferax sp. Atlit-4N]